MIKAHHDSKLGMLFGYSGRRGRRPQQLAAVDVLANRKMEEIKFHF
jgi:hypothetical protein